WIQGPSVAQGYWNRPEDTQATFRAHLADSGEGPFLRTGDLGFVRDHELYVTGRLKDMMIIRGRNYYPQDIEQTAGHAHDALRPDAGAVFTIERDGREQLVVVHEVDRHYREGDFDNVIRTVRRAIADTHELDVAAVVLIRHAALPRTTSGKAQRHVCRDHFEAGDFHALAQWNREMPRGPEAEEDDAVPQRLGKSDHRMTPDEVSRLAERVESWLLHWLVERAAIPASEVHCDRPFAEYGLDSMTAVELSQELEDWVGVEVLPTVAWNYPTPASLSVYLARTAAGDEEAAETAPAIPMDDEFSRLLEEIESLTEDEAARQLES
ncbi:MAG TPA: phosphopantetheine-binding protein, partial [Pirellulaceae bacterium]